MEHKMEKELTELFMKIGECGDWPKYFESPETLKEKIACYSSKLMNEYDSGGLVWDFQLKLIKWLKNVDDIKDKYLLINSLSYFTFFNSDQCKALYREALSGPTIRWLIDIEKYDITDKLLNDKLSESINLTCFSAATDSMSMETFRHVCKPVNTISQTWLAYAERGDNEEKRNREVQLCENQLRETGYKQIVVLEDFVGSGSQIKNVLDFLGCFQEWPILFIPLLVCPQGNSAISKHLSENKFHHITYEPLSVLPWELILADERPADSTLYPPLLGELKKFAEAIHKKVVGLEGAEALNYLGFGKVGALFAKYTNCPDNTLRLYHNKSDLWEPLFLRRDR
jgi:hypothetical protein